MTPLVRRLTAPVFIAALSVASLAVTAAEWAPVHFSSTATAPAQQQARVIVKYKATAGNAKILSATTGGARVPQQAQALGGRLGLALVDGRGMDSQTQLVHASGISSAALAQRLAQDASVEWAVPDRRVRARMVPNDMYFGAGQTDPNFPEVGQWYLRAPDAALTPSAINASAAWDVTKGAGQVVAVLDTGIRPEHPDLNGSRLLAGYNMISLNTLADGKDAAGKCLTGNGACRGPGAIDPGDWVEPADVAAHPTLFNNSCLEQDSSGTYVLSPSSWHGTQVAGIVGATTNNGIGVAGVASDAKILPVRVLGKCGGWDSDIIDAIRWAAGIAVSGTPLNANPAKIINLSLGGAGVCGPAYQGAVNDAGARGSIVVAAAGNDGLSVGAPGNCSGVIAVAGVRQIGTKVGYSSLGPEVAISAPAGNCVNVDPITGNLTGPCLFPILTTLNAGTKTAGTTPGDSIYSDSVRKISLGTSFATPQVAGTVALMLAARPGITPAQVSSAIKSAARSFPTSGAEAGVQACSPSTKSFQDQCYCTTSTCGSGMLDAANAVAMAVTGPYAVINTPSNVAFTGASLTLSGVNSLGLSAAPLSYKWEILSGSGIASLIGNAQAPSVDLASTGTGTVQVRLTVTEGGRSALTTQTVELVSMTPRISASSLAPLVGQAVALNANNSVTSSNSDIAGYYWEIVSGTGLASLSGATNAQSITLNALAAGVVTVKLTLTDTQGLQSFTTASLTIAKPANSGGSTGGTSSSGGGGAWSPLWSLGLLLAALALPGRRQRG